MTSPSNGDDIRDPLIEAIKARHRKDLAAMLIVIAASAVLVSFILFS